VEWDAQTTEGSSGLMTVPGLQSHHDAVAPILAEARVVPFLGAGVNLEPGVTWRLGGHGLPSGVELARWLARIGGFDSTTTDLSRVSQWFAMSLGRGELYRRLRQVFTPVPVPTPVHRFLAEIPGRLRAAQTAHPELGIEDSYLLIATTNYDDALEQAFIEAGEPYDVVRYMDPGQGSGCFAHTAHGDPAPRLISVPNEYHEVSPKRSNVILKLHGTIDRDDHGLDAYVATEDDYIRYLARADAAGVLPVNLAAKIRSSHLLFLGYGLRDWNLRVILHRLWGDGEVDFRSWAIQRDPEQLDIKSWAARGVDIHDVDLQGYIEALSRALGGYLHEDQPPDDGPETRAS
jgi:hypothetical protein